MMGRRDIIKKLGSVAYHGSSWQDWCLGAGGGEGVVGRCSPPLPQRMVSQTIKKKATRQDNFIPIIPHYMRQREAFFWLSHII